MHALLLQNIMVFNFSCFLFFPLNYPMYIYGKVLAKSLCTIRISQDVPEHPVPIKTKTKTKLSCEQDPCLFENKGRGRI